MFADSGSVLFDGLGREEEGREKEPAILRHRGDFPLHPGAQEGAFLSTSSGCC